MKKSCLIFCTIILNISFIYASDNTYLRSKLNQIVDHYIKTHFFNASYMFADDKDVLKSGVHGFNRLKPKKKLSSNQQMPIASTTKSMTAVAILKLQEKGLLSVHDLAMDRLPTQNIKPTWGDKVTIHHLLTHTSGIVEYYMKMKININQSHNAINQDILNYALGNDLSFESGSEYKSGLTHF